MSCLPPPPNAYKAETGPSLQSTCKLTKRRRGHASRANTKFARTPMPPCSEWDPFPSRAKKTSPLYSPNPSPGCGQPAPPLAMLVALERRSQTRRERFFAPRNLSPTRPCRQPTLHRLGVRGSGTASMEGTFFSLGTDSGAMVLHCYSHVCCVEHGCRQELPMGATRSI